MAEPSFTAEELDAVLAPFESARPLPSRAYVDPAVFAYERAEILERSWICVGREEELLHPGQWVRAPITGEGIVITRGADLALHAFYNVCRHRATPLVLGASGRAPHIACPYHGWTYELTGALRSAPHPPANFDRAAHGLTCVRVATWQGFVFVTLAKDAPTLDAVVADAPPWLRETPLTSLKRGYRATYEASANWKLLVENFQESHHFSRIHPALERLTANAHATSVIGDGPWQGGVMTLADGVETVSTGGTRDDRPFIVAEERRRQVFDAILFPTLLTSLQPDYLLTYRLYPISVDKTQIVFDIAFHPAAFSAGFDAGAVIRFWEIVNEEDRTICERQQIGMGSPGYAPSRYASVEDGVHAFDRMIAREYARMSAK